MPKLAKLGKLDQLDQLVDLKKSADLLHNKFDDMKSKQHLLDKKLSRLETRVGELENNISSGQSKTVSDNISKAADLLVNCNFEQRALQMESLALIDELSISSLQEEKSEDLKVVVNNLFDLLDIPFNSFKLKFIRRIGKPGDPSKPNNKQRQRDILVKLDFEKTVDSIINKYKAMVIPGNRILTMDNVSSDVVRIHRRHPSALYKFRQEILKTYPILYPKNVWIMGSAVHVRFSSDKNPLKLLPSTGLNILKENVQ